MNNNFEFRQVLFSFLVVITFGAAGLHATSLPASTLGPQHLMLDLVNHDRTQAGLSPLAWDDKLALAASEHAKVMADQGSISHQFPGEPDFVARLAAHDVRMDRASENVVYDVDLESAHESFMNSPSHRENLFDPEFNAIGIGVVDADGVLYIAEDFAHRVLDASDEQVSQIVASTFKTLWRNAGNIDVPFAPDQRLRQMARSMAQNGVPEAGRVMALPGVAYAATYATSDPESLPISVSRLKTDQKLTHYSVGVYYARTPRFPAGLYWVTIAVSYMPEVRMGQRKQFQRTQESKVKRQHVVVNN